MSRLEERFIEDDDHLKCFYVSNDGCEMLIQENYKHAEIPVNDSFRNRVDSFSNSIFNHYKNDDFSSCLCRMVNDLTQLYLFHCDLSSHLDHIVMNVWLFGCNLIVSDKEKTLRFLDTFRQFAKATILLINDDSSNGVAEWFYQTGKTFNEYFWFNTQLKRKVIQILDAHRNCK